MKIVSETDDELVLGNTAYVPLLLSPLFFIAGAYIALVPPQFVPQWESLLASLLLMAIGIIATLASIRSFYKFTFSRHVGTVRRSYAMGLLGRSKEWQLSEISGVSAEEFIDATKPTARTQKPSYTYGWVVKIKLNDGTSLELNTRTSKGGILGGRTVPARSGEVQVANKIGTFLGIAVDVVPLPLSAIPASEPRWLRF